jgi:hypothetical protein
LREGGKQAAFDGVGRGSAVDTNGKQAAREREGRTVQARNDANASAHSNTPLLLSRLVLSRESGYHDYQNFAVREKVRD